MLAHGFNTELLVGTGPTRGLLGRDPPVAEIQKLSDGTTDDHTRIGFQ